MMSSSKTLYLLLSIGLVSKCRGSNLARPFVLLESVIIRDPGIKFQIFNHLLKIASGYFSHMLKMLINLLFH